MQWREDRRRHQTIRDALEVAAIIICAFTIILIVGLDGLR